jgi:phosphoadenylyl-sulfate reductase (thioredoxin)
MMAEAAFGTWEPDLEGREPGEVLSWAHATFGPRLLFATGFGVDGCVLVDIIARRALPIRIVSLDTGLLFPETYELWRRLERRYGRRIEPIVPAETVDEQAATNGPALWERDPDLCCRLRKVLPLRRALAGVDAWITSIRRDHSVTRAHVRVAERDTVFGLVKINPLAGWSSKQVWKYAREHGVPYNALHDRGYPSIGCTPCTSPVASMEDLRAGRWPGRAKTECGLHGGQRAPVLAAGVLKEEQAV